MKVLIVSYSDKGGGAAAGAVRLCEALNKAGVTAHIGVPYVNSDNPFVVALGKKRTLLQRVLGRLGREYESFKLKRFNSTNTILHSLNRFSLIDVDLINSSDYDLVNLHWICGNTLCARDIAKIKKPIVWTMHDSWPACGAEHHPNILEGDERYKSIYTRQNKPASTNGPDICRRVWKIKYKYLHDFPISFSAPSNWEAEVLRNSSLFGDKECRAIPNIIDSKVFKPLTYQEKFFFRSQYGLSENKITLCFGAADDFTNRKSLKGAYHLIEALKNLPNKEKYQLVVFGPSSNNFEKEVGIKTLFTGFQTNPAVLSKFYAMSDIFLCPSIIENLPFTCLESICCGLAVVAFNQGGVPDIVEHKKNGYLAECYNIEDFMHGIEYCMNDLSSLQSYAYSKSIRDFDNGNTVQKYIEYFEDVIRKHK
ncbi:MAG: glycosyltransferase [Treponema sp.]|nr:glycosyltransferase [Treponema sp.]